MGQVALITGGGRGIGRAVATRLAADGVSVVVTARSQPQLAAVVAEITGAGGEALAVRCDVTRRDEVEHAIAQTRRQFGPITLLVNNAGVAGPIGPVGEVDVGAWWDTQAVHLLGPLMFMSSVVPQMILQGGGRIINICSQAGSFVATNYSSYAVAKCALIRLSEHVAAERRAQNIQVFPLQPGTIITDMATVTRSSAEARTWAAPLVDLLDGITPEQSTLAVARLQEVVSEINGGRWDAISGRYLDVDKDFGRLTQG